MAVPAAERWRTNDQGLHVIAAALYQVMREDRYDQTGGNAAAYLRDPEHVRRIVAALQTNDADTLATIPQEAMLSGSSEIRNWIMVSGMVTGLKSDYMEYIPVHRTPLGSGIGLAFMSWK